MHDVFVSYSHKDKDWVRDYLVPLVKAWGLTVAIDHADFLPGQRLIRSIFDFIRDSRHVIFVCSEAFLQSEWCREELETARSNDPGLLRQKAIPIVLDKAGVSDLLSSIVWCDLERDQSNEGEWRKLCKALKGTWSDDSSSLLGQLFNVAGFFGGYLNNATKTYIIARSHVSQFQGVTSALLIETANSFANIYALLSRYGKTENIDLVLSDDTDNLSQEIQHTATTNYISIGGSLQAINLIKQFGGRQIRYIEGATNYYSLDGPHVEVKKDLLSFLIYKTATRTGNNVIYLFSPWGIGSLAAARMLNEWSLEFAKVERGAEFLHIYETSFSEFSPRLLYQRHWS